MAKTKLRDLHAICQKLFEDEWYQCRDGGGPEVSIKIHRANNPTFEQVVESVGSFGEWETEARQKYDILLKKDYWESVMAESDDDVHGIDFGYQSPDGVDKYFSSSGDWHKGEDFWARLGRSGGHLVLIRFQGEIIKDHRTQIDNADPRDSVEYLRRNERWLLDLQAFWDQVMSKLDADEWYTNKLAWLIGQDIESFIEEKKSETYCPYCHSKQS
jgi:hypothetical protein